MIVTVVIREKIWGNKWSMSWRPIPQEICLANISLKTSVVISATKKLSRRYPAQRQFFWGEIPQDTAFILKILCERYATKQSVKGNCLPNKLRMEISSKQIPKETSTKDYLEKPAYQKKTKRNLYEKNLKRNLSPKKIKQSLYQQLCQKVLPRKLWRDIPCKIKNLK